MKKLNLVDKTVKALDLVLGDAALVKADGYMLTIEAVLPTSESNFIIGVKFGENSLDNDLDDVLDEIAWQLRYADQISEEPIEEDSGMLTFSISNTELEDSDRADFEKMADKVELASDLTAIVEEKKKFI